MTSSSPYRDVDIAAVVAEVVRRLAAETAAGGAGEIPRGGRELGPGLGRRFPRRSPTPWRRRAAPSPSSPPCRSSSGASSSTSSRLLRRERRGVGPPGIRGDPDRPAGPQDREADAFAGCSASRSCGPSVRVGDAGTALIEAAPFGRRSGWSRRRRIRLPTMAATRSTSSPRATRPSSPPIPAAARCRAYGPEAYQPADQGQDRPREPALSHGQAVDRGGRRALPASRRRPALPSRADRRWSRRR